MATATRTVLLATDDFSTGATPIPLNGRLATNNQGLFNGIWLPFTPVSTLADIGWSSVLSGKFQSVNTANKIGGGRFSVPINGPDISVRATISIVQSSGGITRIYGRIAKWDVTSAQGQPGQNIALVGCAVAFINSAPALQIIFMNGNNFAGPFFNVFNNYVFGTPFQCRYDLIGGNAYFYLTVNGQDILIGGPQGMTYQGVGEVGIQLGNNNSANTTSVLTSFAVSQYNYAGAPVLPKAGFYPAQNFQMPLNPFGVR